MRKKEFVVVGILAVVSATLLFGWQTVDVIGKTSPGPLFLPTIVGIAGVVLAIALTIDIATASRHTNPDIHVEDGSFSADMLEDLGGVEGESADLPRTESAAPSWMLALVVGGFILLIVLLPYLGWIFTAAGLFLLVNYALGSRKWTRDVPIAFLMSSCTYIIFALGLGLNLPAGFLGGL